VWLKSHTKYYVGLAFANPATGSGLMCVITNGFTDYSGIGSLQTKIPVLRIRGKLFSISLRGVYVAPGIDTR